MKSAQEWMSEWNSNNIYGSLWAEKIKAIQADAWQSAINAAALVAEAYRPRCCDVCPDGVHHAIRALKPTAGEG